MEATTEITRSVTTWIESIGQQWEARLANLRAGRKRRRHLTATPNSRRGEPMCPPLLPSIMNYVYFRFVGKPFSNPSPTHLTLPLPQNG